MMGKVASCDGHHQELMQLCGWRRGEANRQTQVSGGLEGQLPAARAGVTGGTRQGRVPGHTQERLRWREGQGPWEGEGCTLVIFTTSTGVPRSGPGGHSGRRGWPSALVCTWGRTLWGRTGSLSSSLCLGFLGPDPTSFPLFPESKSGNKERRIASDPLGPLPHPSPHRPTRRTDSGGPHKKPWVPCTPA